MGPTGVASLVGTRTLSAARLNYTILNFGRSPKQLQPEIPHDQHTYNEIWLKLNENRGSSSLLKILTSKIFKVHREWPQTNRLVCVVTFMCESFTAERHAIKLRELGIDFSLLAKNADLAWFHHIFHVFHHTNLVVFQSKCNDSDRQWYVWWPRDGDLKKPLPYAAKCAAMLVKNST